MPSVYGNKTVREIFGNSPVAVHRLFGVEIEVEGANLPISVNGWSAIRDGSLRGESLEYVTRHAVDMDTLKSNLKNLEEQLKLSNSTVNDAHRGSVHIHCNMQHKTMEQVASIIFWYMMVEPMWLTLCGNRRDGNLFCLPSYCSEDFNFWLESYFSFLRTGDFGYTYDRGKYASLNTDCLRTFGTLEFRTFKTTVDPTTILKWAGWCKNLCDRGTNTSLENLGSLWEVAMDNPKEFFLRVFDEESISQFQENELVELMDRGVDAVSNLILVIENYLELTR